MAKSKQTKAHEISKETKMKVWERQKGKSIFSGISITPEMCCCHYVSRGRGGLGEEWNIFGCYQGYGIDEHRLFDEHKPIGNLTHEQCVTVLKNHFKIKYKNWSEDKCKYKKGVEDYGVVGNPSTN